MLLRHARIPIPPLARLENVSKFRQLLRCSLRRPHRISLYVSALLVRALNLTKLNTFSRSPLVIQSRVDDFALEVSNF